MIDDMLEKAKEVWRREGFFVLIYGFPGHKYAEYAAFLSIRIWGSVLSSARVFNGMLHAGETPFHITLGLEETIYITQRSEDLTINNVTISFSSETNSCLFKKTYISSWVIYFKKSMNKHL